MAVGLEIGWEEAGGGLDPDPGEIDLLLLAAEEIFKCILLGSGELWFGRI